MTATFIGHNNCRELDMDRLRQEIGELILKEDIHTFISGGTGYFDLCCARVLNDMRREYPFIVSILVVPFPDFKVSDRSVYDYAMLPESVIGLQCDDAIEERSRYLVDNSSAAICYVKSTYGGVYRTYKYAQKKNIKLIDIASEIIRHTKS